MSEEEKSKDIPETPKEEGEEKASGEEAPPKSSKKKKIIIFLLVLLLGAGGIGALIFLKHKKSNDEQKHKAEEEAAKNDIIYHDIDEMIVNLNTQNKGVSFLKIKITFEVQGKENIDAIKKFAPKIKDAFQLYLRELRPEDMQGSVGLYKLKEELMLRINKIIYPAYVNDILFKDVLVQ